MLDLIVVVRPLSADLLEVLAFSFEFISYLLFLDAPGFLDISKWLNLVTVKISELPKA
jgi:hypothetical protein